MPELSYVSRYVRKAPVSVQLTFSLFFFSSAAFIENRLAYTSRLDMILLQIIIDYNFSIFFFIFYSLKTSTESLHEVKFNFYRFYKAVFLGLIGVTILSVTVNSYNSFFLILLARKITIKISWHNNYGESSANSVPSTVQKIQHIHLFL